MSDLQDKLEEAKIEDQKVKEKIEAVKEEDASIEEPLKSEEDPVIDESSDAGPNLKELLKGFDNSPSYSQVESWKSEYGDIYCSGFTEEEIYVFKAVDREAFVEMQEFINSSEEKFSNMKVEEHIVELCLLWGSEGGMKALTAKAGSCSTLYEQIMLNSNFMSPQVAHALVIKL